MFIHFARIEHLDRPSAACGGRDGCELLHVLISSDTALEQQIDKRLARGHFFRALLRGIGVAMLSRRTGVPVRNVSPGGTCLRMPGGVSVASRSGSRINPSIFFSRCRISARGVIVTAGRIMMTSSSRDFMVFVLRNKAPI